MLTRLAIASVVAAICAQGAPVFGPTVDASQWRVTLFASPATSPGLTLPLGMQQQADGSLLVQTSPSWDFGDMLVFQDLNHDGFSDGPGVSVFTNSEGPLTQLVTAGNYFIQGNLKTTSLSVLTEQTPGSLTEVAKLNFSYPDPWVHPTQGIAVREIPGQPGHYMLVFNVGSKYDALHSDELVTLNGLGLVDVQVHGESLYMVELDLTGPAPTATNLQQVATGIRNVFGLQFDKQGNLWFADNAIDSVIPGGNPPQAEELNKITAAELASPEVNDFGFPTCYTDLSGAQVGPCGGVSQPVISFLPVAEGYSQGAGQIAFAPQSLPAPFNNGVFIGFTGQGGADPRNPVVYYSFDTGTYVHFILSDAGNGSPIGLLATNDSLFISNFSGGEIYQLTSAVPEPAGCSLLAMGLTGIFCIRRRRS